MRDLLRSPSRRPSGRSATAATLLMALLVLSCGREITGPVGGLTVSAPIALLTQFQQVPGQANLQSGVEFSKLRATLLRLDGGVALDRVVDFPSTSDSIALSLTATFGPDATPEGEAMVLALRFITAAGDTVFRSGPDTIFVQPASTSAPPAPVVVLPDYVGPGAQATRVVLSQTDVTVSGANGAVFTAQAFDAQNVAVPLAPILFTSSDTSLVRFANARNGTATTVARRDSARVYATLLTGPGDSARVRVTLPAANLARITGNLQSGPIGTTLGGPVTVRVTASDAVGVAGVAVTFATLDGAVGASPVLTDVNGEASTTWTLGAAVGTQTLTAAVAGLAGSPVTFTATGVSGAAVALEFTAGPSSAVAGLSLGTVSVRARDAQSNVAASFVDSVTLSIGTNVGGGVLGGVRTVAAVNGVAVFTGLTIDRVGVGYTLTAGASGLSGVTSGAFDITPAAALSLAFLAPPPTVAVNSILAPAVQVEARDAFGNRATGFTGDISLALASNPSGAALGGTLTVAATAGLATFPTITLSAIGVGYTLAASAVALTGATSAAFNTLVEVNAWTNPVGGAWSTVGNWSLGRLPIATDSVVIGLPGTYTVTLDLNFSGAFVTVGAGSGTQTLAMSGRTLSLTGQLTLAGGGGVTAISSVLNGGGSLYNGGTLSIRGTSTALPTTNAGLLVANGANGFTGAFATTAASVIRMQPDGSTGSAAITIATGFSNAGLIELTSTGSTYASAFTVSAGTLLNEAGAIIRSAVGTGGGRTIAAAITNAGLIEVNQPLTWNGVSAGQLNTGSIVVNANLTVEQSGTAPSFVNNGAISIATARTLTINGGSVTETANGITGSGTFALTNTTADFLAPWASGGLALSVVSSAMTGAGSVTVSSGTTLSIRASSWSLPLVNEALIVADGSNTISGAMTAPAGSTIRLLPAGSTGFSTLSVPAFTNAGSIELTASGSSYASQLVVSGGTLVNGPSGIISSLVATGGTRTLVGSIDNQGSIVVQQPLAWTAANTVITNSGTLDVSTGNLTITQTGSAQFTTSGTVNIAAARTMTITGGSIAQDGGAFTGTGGLNALNATIAGPGAFVNPASRSLFMRGVTVDAPLLNEGLLEADGSNSITGAITAPVGSTIRLLPTGGTGNSTLTVASGFSNFGLIELTASGSSYSSVLVVTAGTLTNESSGIIRTVVGTGGARTLTAQVNNLGLIDVQQPLTWNGISAASVNTGTLSVAANLSIVQSGTTPSVENLGAITIAGTATLGVTGGTYSQTPTSIAGTGTLAFTNAALTLPTAFATQGLTSVLVNTTVGGAGSLTNSAGRTMTIRGATVNVSFVNEGVLQPDGNNVLTGSVTAPAGSTIRLLPAGSTGFSTLTVPAFTNAGSIELTASGSSYASQLVVSGGTLVNAVGGTISSLPGTGGTRTLVGSIDNQGSIVVQQPLAWTAANTVITNSGTLDVSTGNLTITQTGSAQFTTSGTVNIAAARTMTITGGSIAQSGGAFAGTGGLNFVNATIAGPGALVIPASRTLFMRGVTVNAPLLNEGLLEVDGTTAFTGAITAPVGSTIRLLPTGSTGFSTLTVPAFTNAGSIELTSSGSSYASQLVVSSGTLVNAAGGTISSLPGTGGVRTLVGSIDNQGSIVVQQPLGWTAANTVITNSGTLDVSTGNLTITQTGSAQFTTSGTVNIAAARTMTITGGSIAQSGGAFTGTGGLTVLNATIAGPGAFVNPASRSLFMRGVTVDASLLNEGLLEADGSNSITGAITAPAGSTIRLLPTGNTGNSTLTVPAFTNAGSIELTSSGSSYPSQLVLSGGTLVNAAGGTISSLPGTGGTRTLVGNIDNQGSIVVQQPLNWTAANTVITNSGTLDVSGGNLTINQSGTAAFVSDGTVQVGAGRILRVSGGTVEQTGGGFTGTGEFDVQNASIVGALFAIPSGFSMRLRNATVAAPFTNQGFVLVATPSAINSTLTTLPGSTIRIASDGSVGSNTLTVASGFTNAGILELSSTVSSFASALEVTSGVLTNSAGGAISIAQGSGGSRGIVANVLNQGQLIMSADGSILLNITGSLENTGSIAMGLGGLTAGTQYDRIAVAGSVTLGGTLNVSLVGAFVPVSPNSFTLITSSGAVSGTFATANLPAPLASTPSYSATAVTVAVP